MTDNHQQLLDLACDWLDRPVSSPASAARLIRDLAAALRACDTELATARAAAEELNDLANHIAQGRPASHHTVRRIADALASVSPPAIGEDT